MSSAPTNHSDTRRLLDAQKSEEQPTALYVFDTVLSYLLLPYSLRQQRRITRDRWSKSYPESLLPRRTHPVHVRKEANTDHKQGKREGNGTIVRLADAHV